jgi:DNA-directed RNA polymerase specialized sigma24 family protein
MAHQLVLLGLATLESGEIRSIRRRARPAAEIADLSWAYGCRAPSQFAMVAGRERREIVGIVVGRLGSRDALLVRLRYANELTFAEIGTALGICEDAAFRAHGRMLERAFVELGRLGIAGMRQV